jgi:hypothetical protein
MRTAAFLTLVTMVAVMVGCDKQPATRAEEVPISTGKDAKGKKAHGIEAGLEYHPPK